MRGVDAAVQAGRWWWCEAARPAVSASGGAGSVAECSSLEIDRGGELALGEDPHVVGGVGSEADGGGAIVSSPPRGLPGAEQDLGGGGGVVEAVPGPWRLGLVGAWYVLEAVAGAGRAVGVDRGVGDRAAVAVTLSRSRGWRWGRRAGRRRGRRRRGRRRRVPRRRRRGGRWRARPRGRGRRCRRRRCRGGRPRRSGGAVRPGALVGPNCWIAPVVARRRGRRCRRRRRLRRGRRRGSCKCAGSRPLWPWVVVATEQPAPPESGTAPSAQVSWARSAAPRAPA